MDTATDRLSLAVLRLSPHPTVLSSRAEAPARAHARRLLPLLEEALSEAGAGPGDLGAVVVGTGPGTFTGVRLGVATARALGFSLRIPVVGVSTLAALAAAALAGGESVGSQTAVVPVTDAHRGEVFAAAYRRAADGLWSPDGPPLASPPGGLLGTLGLSPDCAVAVGPVQHPELVVKRAPVEATWLVAGQHRLREPGQGPGGDRLLPWLQRAMQRPPAEWGEAAPGAPGTPESVKPLYVRRPDADLHITRMRDPWVS